MEKIYCRRVSGWKPISIALPIVGGVAAYDDHTE